MQNLKINRSGHTLVDQVEEKLIDYFKEQGLRPGSSIPNENELAASLGIGRTVLREALSRFKMSGMIESRTKRGMTMAEPSILSGVGRCMVPLLLSETTLLELLELRLALEIGASGAVFVNLTSEDVRMLEKIVAWEENASLQHPDPDICDFHVQIYKLIGNKLIVELQEAIMPAMEYVIASKRREFDQILIQMRKDGQYEHVTHADLLNIIKNGDREEYVKALRQHFSVYINFLYQSKTRLRGL